MRVLYLGTPRAAVPGLRALVTSTHAVVGVVCQPDRPAGRGRALSASPVKEAALALGLPVFQPESLRAAALREQFGALRPDVFAVVAYGRLLGDKLLAVPPHGAVNVHFSLLPRWRGAAPVQRAILAGDAATGVTTFRLVKALDAGPVLLTERVTLGGEETAGELLDRLASVGAELLLRTLDGLEAGTLTDHPQDESQVTQAPPLTKSEGLLDPREDAATLSRRVRAFDPWPGTRLVLPSGVVVSVLAAQVAPRAEGCALDTPGTWLAPRGEDLPLACGGGSVLLVRRVRPEGRSGMSGRSLVNGRLVVPGDVVQVEATGPLRSGGAA